MKQVAGVMVLTLLFNYGGEAIHLLVHPHMLCPLHGELAEGSSADLDLSKTGVDEVRACHHRGSDHCAHCHLVNFFKKEKAVATPGALLASRLPQALPVRLFSPNVSWQTKEDLYLSAPKNSPPV